MEAGSFSFLQQSKTGSVSDVSISSAPVATCICSDSQKNSDGTSSKLSQSTHTQPSTVSLGHSETLSRHHGDSLTSAQTTLYKDKPAFESNLRRNTCTRGKKKKIKEILQKADAAGTRSDLYMAYKGPEEKKDSAVPRESSDVINDGSNQKLESVHAKPGSSDEVRDGSSNTEKKYSRDFLKFEDMFNALPQGFDVSPDISTALVFAFMGPMGGMRKNKWQERMKVEGPIPDTVGNKDSCVLLKETSTINESMDGNGFHVLPSQVRRLFERHPDIAVRFRAKNQLLRNSCMNSLLSLIETLCQPLQDISNEDLVGADIALTYVKDSGFRVDWLENKLDQAKEMKEKEVSGLAILQVTEEKLLKLNQTCAELEALAEEQKAELSATRTSLSFDDVV